MPSATTVKVENKKVPRLRFPGFSDAWERKKLCDIGKTYNGLVGKSGGDFGEGEPFVTYKQIFDNSEIDIKKFAHVKIGVNEKQNKAEFGDVFFTTSSETPWEVGFASVLLNKDVSPYLNSFSFGFRPNLFKEFDPYFAKFFFRSSIFRREVVKLAQGSTRYNISKVEFIKMMFALPIASEQQKIADLLESADAWIDNLLAQKENVEAYKKGMMHKIFSQEIRFKDDGGNNFPAWKDRKFLDVFETLSTKKHQVKNSEILACGKYKVVDQSKDLFAGYSNDDGKLIEGTSVIVFGDHTAVLKYIDFDFVVGADGTKIIINKNKDQLKFLYYCLQANPINTEGYKRHYSILKGREISLPVIKEQQKISEFMTSIDKIIESKQQQIAQAEQWKKGLMQGLFV